MAAPAAGRLAAHARAARALDRRPGRIARPARARELGQGPAAGPAEPGRRLDLRRPRGPAADALAGRDQRPRAARDRVPQRAVVGAPGTPTPRGRFAIYEIDRQPDPFGFLGPVALHLTAHSDVLDDYGGGPGRVALHGRGGASLLDPLGSAASHGCIRVDSREVAWLARKVQPGVPVTII
jgi:hypothetical protein